ncbi:MAG: hypothetical protein WC641_08435 [Patescibacteria group bacterium]
MGFFAMLLRKLASTLLDFIFPDRAWKRRAELPIQTFVWIDDRPYRNWDLTALRRELNQLQVERAKIAVHHPLDPTLDDLALNHGLVLDEILQRGRRSKPQVLRS